MRYGAVRLWRERGLKRALDCVCDPADLVASNGRHCGGTRRDHTFLVDRSDCQRPRSVPPESQSRLELRKHNGRRASMTLGTILVILLILILLGALPSWPYSRSWGYYPSGLLGVILIIMIVLLLLGRL
jgi:Protein of unknown function (DUF3309)